MREAREAPPAATSRDRASRQPTAPTEAGGRASLWTVGGIVALGSISSLLSSTVVNVAVSDLQQVFHASLTQVQWVVTGFLLGMSATIPLSGWATDRFGSKRVYLLTLGLFTLASVLCGLAWSIESEIAFRVVQGMAGGMIMPVGMAILMRMTPPLERGRMMSVLGVPLMLGPAVGPTLGGLFIEVFDWRAIFWINLPTGLLALFLGWQKMSESSPADPGPFDWLGWMLASPGAALAVYGLTQAAGKGWGAVETLVPLALALLLVAVFTVWELRQEQPLLEVRILASSAYRAATTVGVVTGIGLFGPMFLVPVFLQQVQGYSVFEAGLLLGAQGVGAAAIMPLSGWLTDRYGARPVVLTGITCLTVATLLLAGVDTRTTTAQWILLLVLRGLGLGCSMMPAFSSAYTGLTAAQIGRATAMSNTFQRIFASLGIAILATVLSARLVGLVPGGARPTAELVARAFDDTFWVAAALLLFGLPAALLLRRPTAPGGRPDRVPHRLAAGTAAVALVASLYFVAIAFQLVVPPFTWKGW